MPQMTEGNYLKHYGILRKSGRYPWGTGNNPVQRSRTFLDIVDQHKKDGLSDSKIAELYSPSKEADPSGRYKMTSTDLRAMRSRATTIQTENQINQAMRLRDKGMSPSEIGRQMGKNESTIRSYLEPGRLEKLSELQNTANMLKKEVAEKSMIDVGAHVERDLPIGDNPENHIGISKDKFNTAISMLKEEGYRVHVVGIQQQGTGETTKVKVLVGPGVTQKDAWLNRDNIQLISKKTDDGGKSYGENAIQPPLHIHPKRVDVVYGAEGAKADGVIYVRPGVKDVSLGNSRYAQVRIAIQGDHYLKGMAVYKDDLPKGIDLQFNTNKPDTGDKFSAMKPMKTDKATGKIDPVNPFGAMIKLGGQIKDKDNNVTSSMNIINEEGDWNKWSKNLSRQFLSKQSPDLIRSQLELTNDRRRQEFEEIKALTNPVIKKKLLKSFSDETDSAAVHMKATSMPRQATKVLMPITSMKPNEIFAPTFENGERVALVRFPHAGKFEIPELVVNNKNREARKLLGTGEVGKAHDVVGIHPKVAEHLSGADFDGDHVVVIPNRHGLVQNTKALEGLKNFNTMDYHVPLGPKSKEHPKGKPIISDATKQNEMGKVSNLITDMTIRGATREDLAHAVKHSMVVIDSEKHNLDYRRSERENNIPALKKKYQGRIDEKGHLRTGAATLISRATAREDVVKRKDRLAGDGGPIDKATGKRMFTPTGERNKSGELKTFRSKKLVETDDAFTLVSDRSSPTPEERAYALHSNKLKALANEARLERERTELTPYNKSSKAVYSMEVASLNAKLNRALKNAPLERQAQVVAGMIMGQRRQANPDMEASEKKKFKALALDEARLRTGAKKHRIDIEDREWEAIQSGAISNSKLGDILNNTDVDKLKERATPRKNPVMTPNIQARAERMLAAGYTMAEVSGQLGIPESTLQSSVGGGE